ncbi:MAG: PKD domain-containing protein, partial [Candidatus Thorarchaeota archaeon]
MGRIGKRDLILTALALLFVTSIFVLSDQTNMTLEDSILLEDTQINPAAPVQDAFDTAAVMGSHTIGIDFNTVYIDVDHDIGLAGAGEWVFELNVHSTIATDRIDVDDAHNAEFSLYQSTQVSGGDWLTFWMSAGEWDEVLTANLEWVWTRDYIVYSEILLHLDPYLVTMNEWTEETDIVDGKIFYYEYYIFNDAPIASSVSGGTIVQWNDISFSGSGSDPEGDGFRYEWDPDYDYVTFDVDSYEQNPTFSYDQPGSYTVAFRVVDDFGEESEIKTATVNVRADTDADGIPNIYDDDDDNDLLLDIEEATWGTSPLKADTDNDRLSDYEEIYDYGTDPLALSSDSDLLSDGEEVLDYLTDPLNPDSDSDGYDDYYEIDHGTDPLNPDVIAPSVSLKINEDAVQTSSRVVMLTIEATDDGIISDMRISNEDGNWHPWEPFTTERIWSLTYGNGIKTVTILVRDSAGNVGVASETIELVMEIGTHSVDITYYQAYIWDDHDDGEDPGEWFFRLFTDSWISSGEYSVDGAQSVNFGDLSASIYITGTTAFTFQVEAYEDDFIILYRSTFVVNILQGSTMNTLYQFEQREGDVTHYYQF